MTISSLYSYTASYAYAVGELYLILERDTLAFNYIESALKRGIGWREVKHSPLFGELSHHNKDFQEMISRAEESIK